MNIIRATFRLFLLAIVTLLAFVLGTIYYCITLGSRKSSLWMLSTFGKLSLWALNVKTNVTGQNKAERVLIMPNHRGYLDIFLILAYSPASIVAKKEMAYWPIVGLSTKMGRMILVNRGKMSSKIDTMKKIGKEVQSGGSVILFPEGKTNWGPMMEKVQAGSFRIAVQTKTPVMPVAIYYHDLNNSWVGKRTFLSHFMAQMGKKKTFVTMHYCQPYLVDDHKALMSHTQEVINAMVGEIIERQA